MLSDLGVHGRDIPVAMANGIPFGADKLFELTVEPVISPRNGVAVYLQRRYRLIAEHQDHHAGERGEPHAGKHQPADAR
jgi:hypothetical protein